MFTLNNCNGSRKERLVIAAANFARLITQVDESLWVFINDGKVFKSNIHSGMYDKDSCSVRFNREWLKTAKLDRIVKCAFHEVFHALQHQELLKRQLGITSDKFTEDELVQMEKEFQDEHHDDSEGIYENLLVEQQAETFAELIYRKYSNEINITDKFIEKYYGVFINEE